MDDYNTMVLSGALPGNRVIKAYDMMALDAKMDDSNPIAGIVRAGQINNIKSNGAASLTPTDECSMNTTYLVADSDSYECTPLIRVGGISGNLK